VYNKVRQVAEPLLSNGQQQQQPERRNAMATIQENAQQMAMINNIFNKVNKR